MARAKGSQTPGWKATEKLQNKHPDIVDKIADKVADAWQVLFDLIDDEKAMPQLRVGASNKVIEAYSKLYKDLKDKTPADYDVDSVHKAVSQRRSKKKALAEKEKKAGITNLSEKTWMETKFEDNGTED